LAVNRWCTFGENCRCSFAANSWCSFSRKVTPPPDSLVICLDEMGPESAKRHPGLHLIRPAADGVHPVQRATQEIDYGRRGAGYIVGAFQPATGDAFTAPYERRTTANFVTFLEPVDAWLPPTPDRVYAILDNLNIHPAQGVVLFALTHPRWAFVFQPTYAA
jgi:hypothetical protein